MGDPGDADFNLVFDFGIDSHELDGLTPQQVFTLGHEFGMVWRDLRMAKEMSAAVTLSWLIHTANVYRCKRACAHHGAITTSSPGGAEGWMLLEARFHGEDV